jgi:hypothetical protein
MRISIKDFRITYNTIKFIKATKIRTLDWMNWMNWSKNSVRGLFNFYKCQIRKNDLSKVSLKVHNLGFKVREN